MIICTLKKKMKEMFKESQKVFQKTHFGLALG